MRLTEKNYKADKQFILYDNQLQYLGEFEYLHEAVKFIRDYNFVNGLQVSLTEYMYKENILFTIDLSLCLK